MATFEFIKSIRSKLRDIWKMQVILLEKKFLLL
jgi:hypothetical protein